MNKVYFAIIGDIVSSRNEKDRDAVQRKLTEVLNDINARYSASIAADFIITLGDEFQGLLHAFKDVTPICIAEEIINRVHPVRVRISIGWGTMSTAIRREAALGADGEAYHNARHGMGMMRMGEKKRCSRIHLLSKRSPVDDCVNTILMLVATMRRSWTKRQSEIASIYTLYKLIGRTFTQKQLADEVGITQGTVNVSLASSNVREYVLGILAADRALTPLREQNDCPPAS